MFVHLDFENQQPLYIQLYEELKNKMMVGELVTGQKLPSKRQLAEDNGISQNTVMNAYDQLMIEGFIRSEERKGYFVEDVHFQEAGIRYRSPQKVERLEEKGPPILYDLTRSTPDLSLFPFSVFSKIYSQLFKNRSSDLLKGTGSQGLADLRHALALYLNQSRGVPCSMDQIVLGPNSQYLFDLFFKMCPQYDSIAIEDPGYDGYADLFQSRGIKEYPIALEAGGIKMADLYQADSQLAFVTPNHQFPTGSVMPLDKRQQLIAWAREDGDRLIIEDDYDGEFKYSGLPIPPLAQLDHHNQVLYLGSFTRLLSPSIRLSYMVLPQALSEQFKQTFKRLSGSLNTFTQYALAEFITQGHLSTHLNRSRRFYKKKRDRLIQAIQRQDPQAVLYGEEAGLSLLVKPSITFEADRLKELARDGGIKLAFLSDFSRSASPEDQSIIYISFSSLPSDEIEELVMKLKDFMHLSTQ